MTDSDPDSTTNITNVNGGVNLDAQRDVNIGGDVVGRDKVTTNIDTGGGCIRRWRLAAIVLAPIEKRE
jgi:hypothetical protein